MVRLSISNNYKLNKKHKDYCFKLYLYNGLKTGKV